MNAFSQINLNSLPSPEIVSELTFDQIFAELKADFKTDFPQYAEAIEFESDPIAALAQTFAKREQHHRAFINAAIKSGLLAFSNGPELEHIAALIPMSRNPGERDDDFRDRLQLAPEGFSVAGPGGAYEFFAKAVSAEILDVYVTSPEPGYVDVYIYQAEPISVHRLAEVKASVDAFRPLTDKVDYLVFDAAKFSISAVLTLADGFLSADVLPAAESAARKYIESRRKFGMPVFHSAISAAMQIEGVEGVNLISPAADIRPAQNAVAVLTGFEISEAAK